MAHSQSSPDTTTSTGSPSLMIFCVTGLFCHSRTSLGHLQRVEVSALALKDSVGLVNFSILFLCFIHSLHLHCVHLIQLSLYHFHVTVGISYYLRHVLYSRGALLIARALCWVALYLLHSHKASGSLGSLFSSLIKPFALTQGLWLFSVVAGSVGAFSQVCNFDNIFVLCHCIYCVEQLSLLGYFG